ncbi:unnamed protein product [Ectocarpus sp. 6 AP-2014]
MMMSVFLSPRMRAIEETHAIKYKILATLPTPTAVIITAGATTANPTMLYYNTTTTESKICPRVPFKQRMEPILRFFCAAPSCVHALPALQEGRGRPCWHRKTVP